MADKILAILVIVSTIFFLLNVVLSAFAGATEGIIFYHRTGDISNQHKTLVTPIGWTFRIWSVIYLSLLSSFIYLVWNIRREISNGFGKLYCNPAIFSKGAAAAFLVNQVFYTVWLFVWDSRNMSGAAIILVCVAISNWTTLVLLSINLFKATGYLSSSSTKDLWLYRILVQNSFGMYTAWTTLAAILNITIALVHDMGVGNLAASMICLSVILVFVVGWFAADIFYFDRYFRYLISPYLTLGWGLTGILVQISQRGPSEVTLDIKYAVMHFVTVLLVLLALLTFVKITLTVYRHIKKLLD